MARLLNLFGRQSREADGGQSPRKPQPVKGGSYEKRIANARTEEQALCIAAVYRAAELRSNTLASMRLRRMQWVPEQAYMKESDYGDGRYENYLLQCRPNRRQNAFQFWKAVEMMRMFEGHCYILPWYDDEGRLSDLIPCHGSWDSTRNVYILDEVNFGIKGLQKEGDDILVLRGIVTRQHPEGESIVHYAARTMSLSATIEGLSLESAAKGGRQKLILQQKPGGSLLGIGGLDPEEMEKQAQRLQDSIYSNDVIFDDSVSDITPINMNAVDLQLLDTRKFTVADIARFFGVPRNLLMDDSNSNYKTAEASTLEFMCRTLAPVMREIEDEFNAKMLTPKEFGRYEYKFDVRSMYSLDISTQSTYNKSRLETGVASVNELRAEMGMPAIDGGDVHFVSCNIAPIGSAKITGETNTNGNSNGDTDLGDD